MIRVLSCIAALACALALAACGQKGPLKHPEAAPTKPAPTSPAPANQ